MTQTPDPQHLLRLSLRGNAAFSTLSGFVFALASGSVAATIGLAEPAFLVGVGVGLLGFAAYLGFLSSRPQIPEREAMWVVWADLAWVVGTVPLVLAGVLSRTGVFAAFAIADVVLVFAALQYLGVRRVRARSVATA